ncbi:MAG: glycoside hydrolase family 16 protein [Fervidobacterium sp.]|uniref:glycoside hydrolase family 16 protein n=1 Tax=Fervidobacterium sp. TaxID=1871331 RepID=UPI0040497A9E
MLRRKYILIPFVFMILIFTSCIASLKEFEPMIKDSRWKLVWSDEFSGPKIDTSKWRFEIGNNNGWGNGEWQYYTEGKNAWIENDMLVIEARNETVKDGNKTFNYTSTRMKTESNFSVQYGKIEARIKFPYGKGLWPAFWMLGTNIRYVGWPMCGEIDIVEFLGHDKWTVYGTLHGPGYHGSSAIGGKIRLEPPKPDFTSDFHVFGIMWDEEKIVWYVDDTVYHIVTKSAVESRGKIWVFDNEFFIILNMAVGGYWPGYPTNETKFPARMYVDYVRVYELQNDE